MLEIPSLHPQVVHFVIALAFVGVGARLVSLLPIPRFSFAGPMATVLILMAAGASVVAVKSGTDAHGPAERVPGARTAVQEHEDAGEWARDWLLALALLEAVGLAVAGKRPRAARNLRFASAAVGLVTLATVYEAGEHGGELVYNYAGGIGIRSGDTADVRHLLIAGLYHNTVRARAAGQTSDAARYVSQLMLEMPNDTSVRLMGAESMLKDQADPRAALARLAAMALPDGSRFMTRRAMLTADAYAAAGVPDSARLVLEALKTRVGDNPRALQAINDALGKLSGASR